MTQKYRLTRRQAFAGFEENQAFYENDLLKKPENIFLIVATLAKILNLKIEMTQKYQLTRRRTFVGFKEDQAFHENDLLKKPENVTSNKFSIQSNDQSFIKVNKTEKGS